MYGKHFASMYEGSMVGSGAIVFALMGYVIANYRLDKQVGAQVRLNPKLLGTILGEEPVAVQKAIEFLCAPDPNSTSKEEEGRRLVKIGEFDYRVVNGAKYTAIRNEEERREKNRVSQQNRRDRKQGRKHHKDGPLPGEKLYVEALKRGDTKTAEHILDEANNLKAAQINYNDPPPQGTEHFREQPV